MAEALALTEKLLGALGFLHDNGLVHRDVKPSNILFIQGEPVLSDPGLVRFAEESGSLAGTALYVPLEQAGKPSADFFALGKVLYECVTGKAPNSGTRRTWFGHA